MNESSTWTSQASYEYHCRITRTRAGKRWRWDATKFQGGNHIIGNFGYTNFWIVAAYKVAKVITYDSRRASR